MRRCERDLVRVHGDARRIWTRRYGLEVRYLGWSRLRVWLNRYGQERTTTSGSDDFYFGHVDQRYTGRLGHHGIRWRV